MTRKKKEEERQKKKWGKAQIPLSNSFLTPALPQISIFKIFENTHKIKEGKNGKRIPEGRMALCIRVCAKRRTRGARAGRPRPSPDALPDWPPAAAGRPAREHTRRARGRVPRGPLRAPRPPTPTPSRLDPGGRLASIPFPASVAFLSLSHPPHPFPSSFLSETRPSASIRVTVSERAPDNVLNLVSWLVSRIPAWN